MRTRLALAALLLISPAAYGCGLGTSEPVSAGVLAALDFAAYPHGTELVERLSAGSFGPFATPGGSGERDYRTADDDATIRAYYQQLAKAHGWDFTPGVPDDPEGSIAWLIHDNVSLTVRRMGAASNRMAVEATIAP